MTLCDVARLILCDCMSGNKPNAYMTVYCTIIHTNRVVVYGGLTDEMTFVRQ